MIVHKYSDVNRTWESWVSIRKLKNGGNTPLAGRMGQMDKQPELLGHGQMDEFG